MSKSEKAYRTISEVASELDIAAHVLRFWETKFPQIKPLKRGGGRRYYRPEDIALLRGVRDLIYIDGMKIVGVQKLLKDHGVRAVMERADGVMPVSSPVPIAAAAQQSAPPALPSDAQLDAVVELSAQDRELLESALAGLETLRKEITKRDRKAEKAA